MMWLNSFFAGALVLGFAAAGLFFFRFFARTRDRLFLLFGVAFWMMAVNRALLAISGAASESYTWLYVIRLAAFVVILVAILDKNLAPRRRRQSRPPAGVQEPKERYRHA